MPIQHQNLNTTPSGTVGYLKFLPYSEKNVWLGALFAMNERGEPLEFTHARLRSPNPLLWRFEDLQRYCLESLCRSMFEICSVVPDVIFCLAGEVNSCLFADHISSRIPVGRVGPDGSLTDWSIELDLDSPHGRLLKCLSKHGLMLEPFTRAEAGLREVYSELLR